MAYDVTKIFQGAPMVKLGELITQRREKNSGLDVPVRGVSREGFINPKQEEADKTKYNVFYKYDFVFNPARMEVNSIALNTSIEQGICSSLYEIFSVDEKRILPEFLNLFVKREEFARQCEYIGSGSAREYCRVANISEIEIPLPAIEVQREYVAAYRFLQQLAEQNEALASQIIATYECVLIKIKQQFLSVKIGPYIEKCDKNTDGKFTNVLGIGQNGFISPQKIPNPNLKNYKIMQMDDICYAPPLYNILSGAIHIYKYSTASVCSPIYEVFRVDNRKVIPEYLLIWLQRAEFKRYAEYYSLGVRNTFDFAAMGQVKIPLPPIEVQRSIVALYNCAEEARAIAKEAREQLKILAPAMVQRAANTPVEL